MKRIFYFLGVLLVLASCTGNKESHVVVPVEEPQPVLLIQPYNDVTVQEAERLKAELERELPRLTGDDFKVKVLPVRQLPDSLKNDARTRFRADKILTWQTRNIAVGNAPTTLLGFTHSDISLPYKGRADWGVLGLSFRGKRTAVISTYRVRDAKRNLWKVAAHEFIHAWYAYPHCPNADPLCIMQDAKGKPNFSNQTSLCDSCRTLLSRKSK